MIPETKALILSIADPTCVTPFGGYSDGQSSMVTLGA